MLHRLLPLTAAAALIIPATAAAGQSTYKVVKATHSSSATKTENDYNGVSTAKWSLAKPSKIQVSAFNGTVTGLGQIDVKGSYSVDVTTDRGHCAFTAPTGDQEHPASAPAAFQFSVGPDPDTGKGALAGHQGLDATLSNAYLGSECSTDVSGEPAPEVTSLKTVSPAMFKKRKVTLRYKGATNDEGIAYRWNTVIVLKRVK